MEKRKYFYTAPELAKKIGLSVQTVYTRFKSPYAGIRWGVVVRRREDGTAQRVVYEKDLYKWKVKKGTYAGRPIMV